MGGQINAALVTIWYTLNDVTLFDSIIAAGISSITDYFFSLRSDSRFQHAKIDRLMRIYFVLDPNKIIHQREVYHILDFIGDIGGLFDGI